MPGPAPGLQRRPSNTQQLIELAFSESEGATTVVMVNSGIATDERRDAQDYGWRGCFEELRAGAGVVLRRALTENAGAARGVNIGARCGRRPGSVGPSRREMLDLG
jgi:hypothetical protein